MSFSVVAMAPREAMLLKSFVRMLDGRTKQRWLFKPQQDSLEQQAVDLTFLGDEGDDPATLASASQGARHLRMGVLSLELYAKLERPLRPDELERELNRMGTLLVQARGTSASGEAPPFFASTQNRENFGQVGVGQPSSMWRPVSEGSRHSEFAPTTVFSNEFSGTVPAALTERALAAVAPTVPVGSTEPAVKVEIDDNINLLRWPHANLVGTPPRLKLAAFMIGSGTTLRKLQTNSGQTLAACTAFVNDLQASGFLRVTSVTTQNSAVVVSAADASYPAPVAIKTIQPALEKASRENHAVLVMPNLFARIRARLGMSMTG